MTISGTYNFNPAAAGLTLSAFARLGIRKTDVSMEHLSDATNEFNFLQVELANHQPNLWRTEVTTVVCVAGTATYNLPVRLAAIQDVYMTVSSGGIDSDRVLAPMSYLQYDAQAQKTQQGVPVSYLINKTLTPTITLWFVPDANATYTLHIRLLSQPQDILLTDATNIDAPYRYLDTMVAGLAYRLARIYAPDKEALRKGDYVEALAAAQATDTQDNVSLSVQPDFYGYYR